MFQEVNRTKPREEQNSSGRGGWRIPRMWEFYPLQSKLYFLLSEWQICPLCSGVSAVPEEGGGLGMIPPGGTLGGFDIWRAVVGIPFSLQIHQRKTQCNDIWKPPPPFVWKARPGVRKTAALWHPFGLSLLTHVATSCHSKIPYKILSMMLESSIRGHSVVPKPSKLIHLVMPFGQKCKKWYLSRFENSSSIFLPIVALHCVSDVIKRGTCCLFGSVAISLNKSR